MFKLISYSKFSRIKKADRVFILAFLGSSNGCMRQEAQETNCPCVVVYNDEGIPIGWTTIPIFKGEQEIHTFVNPDYRKKGIGTALVSKIIKTYWKKGEEELGCYMSGKGYYLYRKFDILYDRYDERYPD